MFKLTLTCDIQQCVRESPSSTSQFISSFEFDWSIFHFLNAMLLQLYRPKSNHKPKTFLAKVQSMPSKKQLQPSALSPQPNVYLLISNLLQQYRSYNVQCAIDRSVIDVPKQLNVLSMDTWVKISELNRNVCHQEVEKCFKSYGLTKKITLEKKFGYKFVAFVQFVNHRDAADAVNDLNGKYVFDKTNKIKVEISRSVRPCSKRKRSPELVDLENECGSSTSYKRSINCQNDMSKSNGNLKLSKSQKRRCDRKDGRRKKMAKIFDNLSSENLLVEEDLKLEDRHLAEVIERMVAAASSKALTELSQEKSWVCGYSWADKVEAEEEQERLFQVVGIEKDEIFFISHFHPFYHRIEK
uniref:RRM domain-containing protein n=1 Tax=Strigamia maritima TaxID=126957 RepID=T1JLH7_STRMM